MVAAAIKTRSPSVAPARRSPARWPLRRASATPPTTAITSSTAVISNAHTKSVNRLFASVSTLPGARRRRACPRVECAPVTQWWPASTTICTNSSTPSTIATGRWNRLGSSNVSCLSTPSSVITNTNSTTIALAYTTTWIAATSAASSWRNSTATLTSVSSRNSAECTGLCASTTPSAPAMIATAQT